jgi:hypothetical protein
MLDPHVLGVELAGSRASGAPVPLSDWDLVVTVDDFAEVMSNLPFIVSSLAPLAEQWDPLGPSEYRCYMLMLAGPMKVDLIFPGVVHDPEPPWTVTRETLPLIDRHLWDWILWMAAKEQRGDRALVRDQLGTMYRHLLEPLGLEREPSSIREAIGGYIEARARRETELGVRVPRRLEREVLPAVTTA